MRSTKIKIISLLAVIALISYSFAVSAAQAPLLVDQPAYRMEVSQITDINGKKAVNIKITPKENSKLNPEFPTKLNIKAPVGFKFSKDSFSGSDFSDYKEKSFEISMPYNDSEAKAGGELVVEIRFGTCSVVNGQTKSCMMQSWKLNFKLEAPATVTR